MKATLSDSATHIHVSISLPLNIIDQSSLEQQVPLGQQVVTDQILVGSHCHPVTNTEGTQDIQNLRERKPASAIFNCSPLNPHLVM